MKLILAIAALALPVAAPATAKTDYPPDPETVLCPPSRGDLDYALDRSMTAAGFQEDPRGGLDTWRRRADGPFHLLSAEPAQWMRVQFKRFETNAGTRVVAELRWQTTRYEFGVKQRDLYEAVQDGLNSLQTIFPCHTAATG
jgi:hypothetical protein